MTEVRDDGVYFRFFPLHLSFHRIGLEEIVRFEVQTYRPIRDYGGWGIRYGWKGKAYNVSGNRGVHSLTKSAPGCLVSAPVVQFVWSL